MTHTAKKVLLFEDEDHIRTVVGYNLEREGFDVYLAQDGASGLELAQRVLPHVVLLDWMMPEMDGLEVLTELKHNDATAGIPVLMLTAKGMATDIEKALELGADDYITKPFDPTMLGETIRKKLSEQAKPVPLAGSVGEAPDAEGTPGPRTG